MEEIEFECPVCDDGKKHKAEVLRRERGKLEREELGLIKGNVEVMIVRCKDCKKIGKIVRHLDYNFEIYDFPSDEESIKKLEKLASET
jgi:uncharacterized Zn finger protein